MLSANPSNKKRPPGDLSEPAHLHAAERDALDGLPRAREPHDELDHDAGEHVKPEKRRRRRGRALGARVELELEPVEEVHGRRAPGAQHAARARDGDRVHGGQGRVVEQRLDLWRELDMQGLCGRAVRGGRLELG